MIQFEPEKFCHRLLTVLLILTAVIMEYPAYYTISRGDGVIRTRAEILKP